MAHMGGIKIDLSTASLGAERKTTPSDMVRQGLISTEKGNPEYFERTLAQRAGLRPDGTVNSESAGSIYPNTTPEKLKEMILTAEWTSYEHPAIMPGCLAFKAPIPGRLGLIELATLPADTVVILDDRKGTGRASATVKGAIGPEVDYTIAILGPNKETGAFDLWTFHPGDPVAPSLVAVAGRHAEEITVAKARELGFDLAKIVS